MIPVKRRKLRSPVWEYFIPDSTRCNAKCKLCILPTELKTPSGGTSTLMRHLQVAHGIYLQTEVASSKNESLDSSEMIAKLAASDGIAFSVIATSPSFAHLFQLAGFIGIPTSGNGVRDVMINFYKLKKLTALTKIKCLVQAGHKFSISLDEWTSSANRRYMNINVHSANGEFWNLGLARVKGSATSQACHHIIENRLLDFGICFSTDIVCLCTDGAAVMTSLGRICNKPQQLCFAHGIHLAVIEVIYKQKFTAVNLPEDDHFEEENLASPFVVDDQDPPLELNEQVNQIVTKIRKIVKTFSKSPLKEESLKKYTLAAHGKDLALVMDVRTRWNSLVQMLERFMLIKDEVQKALIDFKEPIVFTENESILLAELTTVLRPVKLVVEAICRRDSTLISCDAALNFMLQKVNEHQGAFARKLYGALQQRISERRTYLSEIINFLHLGTSDPLIDKDPVFAKTLSQKQRIEKIAFLYAISERSTEISLAESQASEDSQVMEVPTFENLEFELEHAIKCAETPAMKSTKKNLPSLNGTIKKEVALYEAGGTRGKILDTVYKMLITIQPTSVESERAFSSANYLCSKVRSRLGDDTLDALVFLRSYFRNN